MPLTTLGRCTRVLPVPLPPRRLPMRTRIAILLVALSLSSVVVAHGQTLAPVNPERLRLSAPGPAGAGRARPRAPRARGGWRSAGGGRPPPPPPPRRPDLRRTPPPNRPPPRPK